MLFGSALFVTFPDALSIQWTLELACALYQAFKLAIRIKLAIRVA
jgi:hypothetical protein